MHVSIPCRMQAARVALVIVLVHLVFTPMVQSDWTRSIRPNVKPDKTVDLKSFQSPSDVADRYSSRIRGYVYPPKTGDYVFGITSDDQSKLYLSTDSDPKNKKLMAGASDWTEAGNYKKFPTQKSKPIRLVAGRKYYIEAIHRENTGGDHVAVGWMTPGKSAIEIIPGANLSPFGKDAKGKIVQEVWSDPVVPPIQGTPDIKVASKNDPTKPVPGGVRWFWNNHQSNLQKTKANNFDVVFLGDSITSGWPGDLMKKACGKYRPSNFGIGGDRAENVLFRLNNGELAWTSPKVIVLLLGVNNLSMGNNPGEVALGVSTVITKLRAVVPDTKILLLGVFPTKLAGHNAQIPKVNAYLAKMDDGKMVRFLDINAKLMGADGQVRKDVMKDAVHLNRNGYVIWRDNIAPVLTKMMK
jgi:lysophospholipase L1-like esterase